MTSTSKSEFCIDVKKELKRIEWSTVKRIVVFLHYNNKFKRTKIAMRCNMAYDKFLLYLDWLYVMELVTKEIDEDGFEIISLSEGGNSLFSKLQDDKVTLEKEILSA
jgi:predicted transcriptional regulator